MIVAGIDMAFANVGLALFDIDASGRFELLDLELVKTESSGHKEVRKSSEELRRAQESCTALRRFCSRAAVAVAEVPSGSQSAGAARALGIAVGVLASCPVPVIEVSQREVKLAVGGATTSKAEIIRWAMSQWPDAKWLTTKRKGKLEPTAANEHLADACAAVKAGVATSTFKLILASHGLTSAGVLRPAPDLSAQGQLPLELVPVVARRVRVRAG